MVMKYLNTAVIIKGCIMFIWWSLFPLLLLSAIPAYIAQNKGQSFGYWYVYGFLLLPIALIHSLIMTGDNKKCLHCAELIKQEAVLCRYCNTDQPAFVSDGTAEVYKGQSISEIPDGYRALGAWFETVADAKSYIDNNPSLHR